MKESHRHQYDLLSEQYYREMQSYYRHIISHAPDPEFASTFVLDSFINESKEVPVTTFFFDQLVKAVYSIQQTYKTDVLDRVFEVLPEIKEKSQSMATQLYFFIQRYLRRIPDFYKKFRKEGATSQDLLDKENAASELSDSDVVRLIARITAYNRLVSEIQDAKQTKEHEERLYGITRSQQALFFYYLMEAAGTKIRQQVSVSKCTKVLHTFLGLPFTDARHSELYRKLLEPFGHVNRETILKNLHFVRNLFAELDNLAALKLIDRDITSLEKE